jgi:hypothetical protein
MPPIRANLRRNLPFQAFKRRGKTSKQAQKQKSKPKQAPQRKRGDRGKIATEIQQKRNEKVWF